MMSCWRVFKVSTWKKSSTANQAECWSKASPLTSSKSSLYEEKYNFSTYKQLNVCFWLHFAQNSFNFYQITNRRTFEVLIWTWKQKETFSLISSAETEVSRRECFLKDTNLMTAKIWNKQEVDMEPLQSKHEFSRGLSAECTRFIKGEENLLIKHPLKIF